MNIYLHPVYKPFPNADVFFGFCQSGLEKDSEERDNITIQIAIFQVPAPLLDITIS